jgi:hypothetical protein
MMKPISKLVGRFSLLAITLVALQCGFVTSVTLAEPPIYEPYGAWRGRIKYVEGPRRTRTHIRWGNGITPVGGQVLMHLATVAGEVATNENVLNAVTGREAEINADIVRDVAKANEMNKGMLDKLNAIRTRTDIGLPAIEFRSTTNLEVSESSGAPEVGGSSGKEAELARKKWNERKKAVEDRQTQLLILVVPAAETANQVVASNANALKQWNVLKEFRNSSKVLATAPPGQVGASPANLEAFNTAVKKVSEDLPTFITLLEEAQTDGLHLLKIPGHNIPDDGQERITSLVQSFKDYAAELKALTPKVAP